MKYGPTLFSNAPFDYSYMCSVLLLRQCNHNDVIGGRKSVTLTEKERDTRSSFEGCSEGKTRGAVGYPKCRLMSKRKAERTANVNLSKQRHIKMF